MNIIKAMLFSTMLVIVVACQNQTPEMLPSSTPQTQILPEITPSDGVSMNPFEVDLSDLMLFETGLIEEAHPILDELTENTIYQMDWTLSPELDSLSGEVVIRYTNREEVALNQLYLRLYPNISGGEMSITELEIDGESVHGSLQGGDSVLGIELSSPLERGTQVVITGAYSIQLPLEMSGNYGLFGSFDGLLVLQETYPIIPVYDEDGWDIDLPAPHGDLTHLDVSYYIVRVKLPDDLKAISSGVVLDHRIKDGWQTLTFAAGPVRDYYLAAGDFQRISTSFGETMIHSYILPGAEEFNDTALKISKTAIAIFNQRLGKYPYNEFDMISTPMLALGMEYPGIVALNMNMYDPEAQISDLPGTYFLEGTIAHEVAHQWYYNLVGNDQLEDPWLDEAITQYLTGIYFLDTYGENAFQEYRQSWLDRWQRVEQQTTPISLPAADYDGRAYGAIVYGRGPLFVEALAEEMGEETFWEFMRSFTDTHKWDITQPETFISMAESTCACDLAEIWETWGVYP
jgi:aminopeptidase N